MGSGEAAIDVVKRFCEAWGAGDYASLPAYFTEDAVYHNIPLDPVTGREAIGAVIAGFTTGVDRIEFRVRNIGAVGNVVMTERVDVFVMPHQTIELPVMGTFELSNGLISAWRDYFDMNQFTSQMKPAD